MDPTGLDSSVTTTHTLTDVAAGSYSVSVMAENEHGTSQDATVTFLVEGIYVLSLAVYKCVECMCCVCMLFCAFWYTSGICQHCYAILSFQTYYIMYVCRSVMGLASSTCTLYILVE